MNKPVKSLSIKLGGDTISSFSNPELNPENGLGKNSNLPILNKSKNSYALYGYLTL